MEHVISSRLFFAVSLKLLATENSSDCDACTRLREFSLLVAEILCVLSQAFKLYVFPLPRGFLALQIVRVRILWLPPSIGSGICIFLGLRRG